MLKSIKWANLEGKRVLLRVDFNVPFDKKGKISDDYRIISSLPTIQYLIKNKAKIIIITHLGDPAGRKNKKFSLKNISKYLSKVLKKKVIFANDCIGNKTLSIARKMKNGDVLFLENVRFYPGEEKNNLDFAYRLSKIAEIYVNDAFSVSHRNHASVSAITKFLPAYAGFLLEREVNVLSGVFKNPEQPLCIIIGGAKTTTKIPIVKRFYNISDALLFGGAVANTMIKMRGVKIGKSLFDKVPSEDFSSFAEKEKVYLPVDVVVAEIGKKIKKKRTCRIDEVLAKESILDIGPETVDIFSKIIKESKTIIWNGPMGLFEEKDFSLGTKAIAKMIADSGAYSIIGGGDTIAAIKKFNLFSKISYVSTGGGAMLDFLSGKEMAPLRLVGYFN